MDKRPNNYRRPALIGALLSATLLTAMTSFATAAADSAELLGPQDFAYGQDISVEGHDPFYRLLLPEAIYQQTAWPDLRDVRVFGSDGQAVPFALEEQEGQEGSARRMKFKLFPMQENAAATRENGEKSVILKAPDGMSLTMTSPVEDKQVKKSWLLSAGPEFENRLISHLNLEWPAGKLRRATVSVLNSTDLREWVTQVEDVPLLELAADNDRLVQNKVTLNSYNSTRWWLVVIKADTSELLPDLSAVEAVEQETVPDAEMVSLPLEARAEGKQPAVYTLHSAQPLAALEIWPSTVNTVQPMTVEIRPSADDSWTPLTRQVFYQLDNQGTTAALKLRERPVVQAIRLTAISSQWGEQLPLVRASRVSTQMIFNASGKGPWLLAWGSRAAQPAALPIASLMPGATVATYNLPAAYPGKSLTLGGEQRLTALAPAEQRSQWMKIALWVLLVAGAGGLALMAWRLGRDLKRPPQDS